MPAKDGTSLLTKREKEILLQLATGDFYKEIADKNGICIDTVKKHCKNIYRKLQVKNKSQALRTYGITMEDSRAKAGI